MDDQIEAAVATFLRHHPDGDGERIRAAITELVGKGISPERAEALLRFALEALSRRR